MEHDVGELRVGERDEMGYERTGVHDEKREQFVKMLRLKHDENEDERVHSDENSIEHPRANLVLKARPQVMDNANDSEQQNETERDYPMFAEHGVIEQSAKLGCFCEMADETVKVIVCQIIDNAKPIGCNQSQQGGEKRLHAECLQVLARHYPKEGNEKQDLNKE